MSRDHSADHQAAPQAWRLFLPLPGDSCELGLSGKRLLHQRDCATVTSNQFITANPQSSCSRWKCAPRLRGRLEKEDTEKHICHFSKRRFLSTSCHLALSSSSLQTPCTAPEAETTVTSP